MSEAATLETGLPNVGMLQRAYRLKDKLRQGRAVTGAWVSLTDPATTEMMARVGFDYLMFDTEHSPWDLQSLQLALIAMNGTDTVPFARVAWNDHVRIKQLLDLGVEGILAPMVRTVQEVQDLVAACRYPPVGRRGFGPRRASGYYRNLDAYVAAANEAIFVMPQVEHIETIPILDDYLAVPGIDAVCIGPNDLSGTVGVLRQYDHPVVRDALNQIISKAKARNLPVCLGINTPAERQRELVESGVRILLVTSDIELISGGARRALEATLDALG